MSNASSDDRKGTIRAGFSPRPVSAVAPLMASSPSIEPETLSPNALLDGPVIQRLAVPQRDAELKVKNGIVSFGK
jgi:hypothetical protein